MFMRGMGATGGQILATAGSVGGSTAGALTPILFGAAAGPIGMAIGAGVAAITGLLGVFGVGSGCGQTCITASNDANAIETAMKANLAAFQAGQIDQATAEANFETLWQQLETACAQIGGTAGTNCIADRQAGACKIHDSSGQCWDWFKGYLDPIQNAVQPSVAGVNLSSFGSVLPIVGLGLAAWALAEAF